MRIGATRRAVPSGGAVLASSTACGQENQLLYFDFDGGDSIDIDSPGGFRDSEHERECFPVEETIMTVAKVIEITAESNKSFEDAIRQGVEKATESVHNVRSAWVKEQQVSVVDGKVAAFRVGLMVTFVLD
ncbi:MAG TPA: dodecin family protein [Rhodocyclaceae bacterium]|nr:dodecin family protein [Rhodocyclaceae bacterium]